MFYLNKYKDMEIKIPVNGEEIVGHLSIKWDYDDSIKMGQDFDFGNEKDNSFYLEKFYNGELQNIFIQVSVMAEGMEGLDNLGGCHISSKDFDSDILDTVRDCKMIENAQNDLIFQLLEVAQKLQKFINKG